MSHYSKNKDIVKLNRNQLNSRIDWHAMTQSDMTTNLNQNTEIIHFTLLGVKAYSHNNF